MAICRPKEDMETAISEEGIKLESIANYKSSIDI